MEALKNTTTPAVRPAKSRIALASFRVLSPGLAVAFGGALVAIAVTLLIRGLSPLLVAIALGLAARNLGLLPERLSAGLTVASRVPLRLGIVILGLQLSLQDLAALGWGIPLLAVAVVAIGILGTVGLGRLLKVPLRQTLLVACGFSICGAAAVAGAQPVVDADEEETVTAVALVVLFGTLMIPSIPLLASLLGLPNDVTAVWAGASIHEVAQVVAVGGIIGGSALATAVTVKLARVLMLAPTVAILSWLQHRAGTGTGKKRPPIVPLFMIGFIVMVILRSTLPIPAEALGAAATIQSFLLTAAMLALGTSVRLKALIRRGGRTLALAAGSTAIVCAVGLAGALLVA
ncbi:YeiH family protein [Paenarthrobacter ureafaciens]|uniref:YeiH family protein n=1 Tax=Paenarthrobacter ureafaciens TaxID=37931 RepID=UPI001916CECD|nr:putative sulfate exporter family transporter [Paenarthrobacter ureafaciens]QQQ64403.1 putative sulfate exporter family transporter [Paenarthrobacter ureafaciens]